MKIAQDINVDGITIVITEGKDGTQPKMNSVLQFTDRELQIPPAQIQQLLFRELLNSNRVMVCTGFQYGNEWYGDRPDNGAYKNVFTGTTEYIGEKPKPQAKVIVQEGWQGIQLSLIGVPNEEVEKFTKLYDINWNDKQQDVELTGVISDSELENCKDIHFESSNVVVSYADFFTLAFGIKTNETDIAYMTRLGKTKDTSGLGTFETKGDYFSDLINET